jgi:hypothetical protein
MQPKIVEDDPGHRPICRMPLEPITVEIDQSSMPELVDRTRRSRVVEKSFSSGAGLQF